MKAVGVQRALSIEDPTSLVDLTLPVPEPGPHDLLVQVEAISVNPADYRVRQRKADDGRAAVLGWDVAGTVIAMGPEVRSTFRPGDAVYYAGDLERPGANSEFHVVDARIVGHRPRSLSAAESAALPLTALTAWEALFDRMGLGPGGHRVARNLLIVGGAGGTGSMAIQLAGLVPDLTIIATASRPSSQTWCRRLGADLIIDHFGDMRRQLRDHGHEQVDAILLLQDPDAHFPTAAQLLAPQGVICSIVPFERAPDLNVLMRKSATFAWEFMFTRPMWRTPDIEAQGRILDQVSALIDAGKVASAMTETLRPINAQNLRTAHRLLEGRRVIGKITLAGF